MFPDELWGLAAPLLPVPPRPKSGRPRLDNSAVLSGILFVLRYGLPWRALPRQLGFGSGLTCWRQFKEWQAAGVWTALHRAVLEQLHTAELLDRLRASLDLVSIPAPKGGKACGPCPTVRGKSGSKIHLLVDRAGTPSALTVSGANVHDNRQSEATVDAVPPVRNGRPGRPRRRPSKLRTDKAYDARWCRRALRARRIKPRIARLGVELSARLERHRWCVERSLSWLVGFEKLAVRQERCVELYRGLCLLACAVIGVRRLGDRW
ncbi:IS5 family transposase [Deinococcus pimensis]|uniref:IS5 family transposase n=1 Tax=Deinococcus pimensis TaxID=309888 RepID=UPI0009FFB821|nr:IS5 family transposase [Deinococcus pimensis]